MTSWGQGFHFWCTYNFFYWRSGNFLLAFSCWDSSLLMAEAKSTMRKPVFTKVDQLRPGTSGHNLAVKVVSAKTVLQKGRPDGPQVRQMRISECLVGDETGTIVFTARNEQGIYCSWYWWSVNDFTFYVVQSC